MHLSIGEFAQRSGVSPHALRHWHQQEILLPATVDAKTGYQIHTPDQLDLRLKRIIRQHRAAPFVSARQRPLKQCLLD